MRQASFAEMVRCALRDQYGSPTEPRNTLGRSNQQPRSTRAANSTAQSRARPQVSLAKCVLLWEYQVPYD
jgi:hypothetical protein